MSLVKVKTAIDTYLAAGVGGLMLPVDQIIELYVENVGGFKEIKEQIEELREKYKDVITKEELDELIEEEKKKAIAKLKEEGAQVKKEIEDKINELKASITEIKNTAAELGKEMATALADALVPVSLGPVVPNPIHNAIRLYLNVVKVKRAVDLILAVTSRALGLIIGLGLEQTPLAEGITRLVEPLLALKAQAESESGKAEAVGTDPNPAATIVALRTKYEADYPGKPGVKINGLEIESKTREKYGAGMLGIGYPLTEPQILVFEAIISSASTIPLEKVWAQTVLRYHAYWRDTISLVGQTRT